MQLAPAHLELPILGEQRLQCWRHRLHLGWVVLQLLQGHLRFFQLWRSNAGQREGVILSLYGWFFSKQACVCDVAAAQRRREQHRLERAGAGQPQHTRSTARREAQQAAPLAGLCCQMRTCTSISFSLGSSSSSPLPTAV